MYEKKISAECPGTGWKSHRDSRRHRQIAEIAVIGKSTPTTETQRHGENRQECQTPFTENKFFHRMSLHGGTRHRLTEV